MHRDRHCCIILLLVIGFIVLKFKILKGNLRGRPFVKVSASWGQKGWVSWSLSNFISRTWTVSLTGTVMNSHSTSKDTMISEMYPECVIASWDAFFLLLDAEKIEWRVQLDAEKKIECLCKLQTPGKNSVTRYANLCFVKTIFINWMTLQSRSISL